MSGPKISIYEVFPKQNFINAIKQIIDCKKEINRAFDYFNVLEDQIQSLLSTFELINKREGSCCNEIALLDDLQKSISQKSQLFKRRVSNVQNIKMGDVKFIFADNRLTESKGILKKSQKLLKDISAAQKDVENILINMDKKALEFTREIENTIADEIAMRQMSDILECDLEDKKLEIKKQEIERELRIVSADSWCPIEFKNRIISADDALSKISSQEALNVFQAITLEPLIKQIKIAQANAASERKEYDKLYEQFSALCGAAGILEPEKNISLQQLKDKIAELEKQIVIQAQQSYISDCVNEAMVEMGYDIIGNRSVAKKSGKKFRNELYSYGDGTAVNVTYDSEGQIAMELGGLDRTDRLPTLDETNILCKEMESFCLDFKELEERIKAKGVVLKSRISMAPPSGEYAAIINISDYNVPADDNIEEITFHKKSSKPEAKHYMRTENKK